MNFKLRLITYSKTAFLIVFTLLIGLIVSSPHGISTFIEKVTANGKSSEDIVKLKENLVVLTDKENKKSLKEKLTEGDEKKVVKPEFVSKEKIGNFPSKVAQKNGKSYLETVPNDTFYSNTSNAIALPGTLLDSWNLRDVGFLPTDEEPLSGWDLSTGANHTIVATIDTGIDLTHPELQDNLWINSGEIASNGLDDDGNGFIDDVYGYNFADSYDFNGDGDFLDTFDIKNPNTADLNGHGTHVAGVIAAKTNNSLGVAGICQTCKVMALKVINSSGFAFDSDVAYAIIYASNMGAKVINISLGGGGYSEAIDIASAYAYLTKGSLVVGAAGNDTMDSSDSYPGATVYGLNVGASNADPTNPLSNFSNFGKRLDILAPGGQLNYGGPQREAILSTYLENSYATMKGTSMASPHVAGVAGLLYDLNPTWDSSEVRYALLSGVTDIVNVPNGYTIGFDTKSGYGKLNSISSLQKLNSDVAFLASDVTSPTVSVNAPVSTNVRGTINITGTVNDVNIYMYTVYFERTSDNYIISQRSGRSNVADNTLLSIDTTNLPDGEYDVYVRAEDYSGNDSLSGIVTITVDNTPPSVPILTTPSSNGYTSLYYPILSWQGSTDLHGPVTYDVYLDSSNVSSGSSNLTYTSGSILNNGTSHTWYIVAFDSLGNSSQSSTRTFTVDLTTPGILSKVASYNQNGLIISITTSTPISGISSLQISINGGAFVSFTPPYTNNTLADGTYSYVIRITNGAGNYSDSAGIFVVEKRKYYLISKSDFNNNGKVDLSDLSILAQYWGGTNWVSDSNFDGKVDLSDLSILATNWNKNY